MIRWSVAVGLIGVLGTWIILRIRFCRVAAAPRPPEVYWLLGRKQPGRPLSFPPSLGPKSRSGYGSSSTVVARCLQSSTAAAYGQLVPLTRSKQSELNGVWT